jgi:hypothetical protein
MSKLRSIHKHLIAQNLIVDSVEPAITLAEFQAMNPKERKYYKWLCRKQGKKLPTL